MSPKQIIQTISFFGTCCLVIGLYTNFSSILVLLCIYSLTVAVTTWLSYLFSMRKEGFKFDEPLFEKGSLKESIKLIKKLFK